MPENIFAQSVEQAKLTAFKPVANVMNYSVELSQREKEAGDVVKVPLLTSSGDTNVSDYTAIGGSAAPISVTLAKITGAQKITAEELGYGQTLESRVKSAMNGLSQKINTVFTTAVQAHTVTENVGALSAFGISDCPAIYPLVSGTNKRLALRGDYFAGILATDAHGLVRKSGDQGAGFDSIEEVSLPAALSTFVGFAASPSGIAVASAKMSTAHYALDSKVTQAYVTQVPELGGIEVVSYVMDLPTNHDKLVVCECLFGVSIGESGSLVKLVNA